MCNAFHFIWELHDILFHMRNTLYSNSYEKCNALQFIWETHCIPIQMRTASHSNLYEKCFHCISYENYITFHFIWEMHYTLILSCTQNDGWTKELWSLSTIDTWMSNAIHANEISRLYVCHVTWKNEWDSWWRLRFSYV